MGMVVAIYWPRGSTQARIKPENILGIEEAGRRNSHKGVRDSSNYINTAIKRKTTGETKVDKK